MPYVNHRELNRKERARQELNTMCREYDVKCSPPILFNYNQLSPAQQQAFACREPAQTYLGVQP